MDTEREVLCAANAYEKKYYFNKKFEKLPSSIQDELHIICVLFTEEVGGMFSLIYEPDGMLTIETESEEDDIYYDEISAGLLVKEVQNKRQELFESLRLFYRAMILGELPDLSEEE